MEDLRDDTDFRVFEENTVVDGIPLTRNPNYGVISYNNCPNATSVSSNEPQYADPTTTYSTSNTYAVCTPTVHEGPTLCQTRASVQFEAQPGPLRRSHKMSLKDTRLSPPMTELFEGC